ncbi:MAG: hypothetical protein SPF98_06115 [Campylobacter sp.]|nr:hypothetical protein [Campylobacter sp.]
MLFSKTLAMLISSSTISIVIVKMLLLKSVVSVLNRYFKSQISFSSGVPVRPLVSISWFIPLRTMISPRFKR